MPIIWNQLKTSVRTQLRTGARDVGEIAFDLGIPYPVAMAVCDAMEIEGELTCIHEQRANRTPRIHAQFAYVLPADRAKKGGDNGQV